ncbi:MAG: repeat protein, partial [Verrucomicrobia bacterium]|nr:repeat protein [Verrucomicrobiota bacterium]
MKQMKILLTWLVLALAATGSLWAAEVSTGYGPPISVPIEIPAEPRPLPAVNWIDQSREAAHMKSRGCIECHKGSDNHTMHKSPNVVLGCTDCHGGNPAPGLTMRKAHVEPRFPDLWVTSANPNDSSVLLNHESPEFVQFVNPGDLRVANKACGLCHEKEARDVGHSMMRHGAMLWGAALYNNGSTPNKNYNYGQAYGPDGVPLRLVNPTPVTPEDTKYRGIVPFLDPLPRFALSQPGNILRIFEKGGEKQLQLGVPTVTEPPGKPIRRLSDRGLGTLNRIDPVFLNLQKTRLHDPLLDFMGSNNHPGDYRSSGCTACHVVYANDRSPTHSSWYFKYGHQGLSFSGDESIRKNERGHPIKHEFTRAIPTSQCMNCHMHQ